MAKREDYGKVNYEAFQRARKIDSFVPWNELSSSEKNAWSIAAAGVLAAAADDDPNDPDSGPGIRADDDPNDPDSGPG